MCEISRAEALLREWTKGESLAKHGLAVAACVEGYGQREAEAQGLSGEAAEEMAACYRCAGLLHDMDYERHPTPEEHPFVGVAFLRVLAAVWPDEREQVTAYWTGILLQLPIGWTSVYLLLSRGDAKGQSLEIWYVFV